jgi:hypothetical protein
MLPGSPTTSQSIDTPCSLQKLVMLGTFGFLISTFTWSSGISSKVAS